jgi:lincosamide nucleotidyltransferase A/C/D/E
MPAFRSLLKAQEYKAIKLDIARPHNFVLADDFSHEIDVHVIDFNDKVDGMYGPIENGEVFPAASLTGKGKIGNLEVNCISPVFIVKFHSGYELKEKDCKDILAICKKFDLEIPRECLRLK